jgi:hypothetical protein
MAGGLAVQELGSATERGRHVRFVLKAAISFAMMLTTLNVITTSPA